MIAIDTGSLIAYVSGAAGPDGEATDLALAHRQAALPPIVLSKLLSDPKVGRDVKAVFLALPLLEILDGYWERAGLLRAKALAQGRRARLADKLIAQSCLDRDVELVTRDSDFNYFRRLAGLRPSRQRCAEPSAKERNVATRLGSLPAHPFHRNSSPNARTTKPHSGPTLRAHRKHREIITKHGAHWRTP